MYVSLLFYGATPRDEGSEASELQACAIEKEDASPRRRRPKVFELCMACRNDSHNSELDGTQLLNPQGDSVTHLPSKMMLALKIEILIEILLNGWKMKQEFLM